MLAIVAQNNNWYCKNCKREHDVLYLVKKDEGYCSLCVPKSIKDKCKKVNQNREEIEE